MRAPSPSRSRCARTSCGASTKCARSRSRDAGPTRTASPGKYRYRPMAKPRSPSRCARAGSVQLARAALCLALCAASAAHAGETRVISPRPDTVSVTIYRDLFALITETRTVDLPEEPVTLVFDGVVETLIPQSALIADT